MGDTIKAYYRLTKPGIIYGNLLSTAAGFFLASRMHVSFELLLGVLAGIAFVIASACVLNNIIDRDIDKKMTRTKKRALVTGKISPKNATIYGIILGVAGFVILLLTTNLKVVLLGFIALFLYVVAYGIAKRKSVYGTLVGSVPGALPIVAGYVAVTNGFDSAAVLLFLILTVWQMPHFYTIAMFRKDEYSSASIPVFPVKNGALTTKKHVFVYILLFIIATTSLTLFGYTGITFLVIMLLIGGMWLTKAVQGFRVADDKRWARGMFFFSLKVLLVFCFSVSLAGLLP